MEEENIMSQSIVDQIHEFFASSGVPLIPTQKKLDSISTRLSEALIDTIHLANLDDQSFFKSSEESGLTLPDNFLQKYRQRECAYFPLHWSLPNKFDSYYIYGGLEIDFSYRQQDIYRQKRQAYGINHIEYFRDKGILLLQYEEQQPTVKQLDYLIKRAQQMNDQQYYILSLCLIEYQKQIPRFLSMMEQKSKEFRENNLFDNYEESYLHFEKWALSEIMKLDSSRLFGFQIHKFNLNTLELEVKKVGYSTGLMALRGIDIENPYQYMRRETYHYLDGESNINLLINQLARVANGKQMEPFKIYMMTFDRLKIEVDLKCIQFTNRDENYPHKDDLKMNINYKYEFMVSVGFYEVTTETLQLLIHTRSHRNDFENEAFDDFTYSLESQVFLEKFYKKKTENLKKSIENLTVKKEKRV